MLDWIRIKTGELYSSLPARVLLKQIADIGKQIPDVEQHGERAEDEDNDDPANYKTDYSTDHATIIRVPTEADHEASHTDGEEHEDR